nr:fibroblast growth factor receptor 3-like [Ciona intestinalis]|eukprot:XP_026690616.1 fibroblast growth factor receptor 3-like [Ciona intestinalis]
MKSYKFSLLPYHRESVALRFTGPTDISAITQCVELVRRDLPGLSQIQGEELCCGAGIAQRVPRDVTAGRFTPTILHGDVINLSVEISWRPPVTQQNLLGIEIFVFPANSMLQQPNKTDIAEFNVVRNGSSCDDNSTLTYTVNVTGLILEETYTVRVEPRYSSSVCTNPQCIATISFTPEVDVCSPEWNICDVNATCLSSSTNQSATCNCTLGFEGNGLNNGSGQLGTGCSDINYCSPDKSPCVEEATCVDLPAPMLGATCVCPFTGDGLLNGSGCTPISTLILGVTIPAVTLLLLLVILIAWRIRVRNIRKRELTWSEFVANKSRMMDFIAAKKIQELGENQPVFGEKWELSENDIVFGEVLGRGNYGVVHKGCYNGQDSIDNGEGKATEGVPVAIKTMKDGVYSKNKLVEFLSEIHFMLNIGSHPNVLSVIGCCTVKQPIMLVTELLKYGDLLAFLHEAREPNKRNIDPVYHITEKSLWNIAHQVALGLEYLTKTRIIHGDVAARNILVGENLVCKIADFGLANDVYRYGVIKGRAEKCVPLKWVSPERMQSGEVPITSRSDVWSFGILLYEMTTLGGSPYPGIDQDTLLMKIKAGYRMEKPASCSTEMYALMKKCWKLDPWKRPTFTQVVKELNAAILRMKVVDNNDIVVELDNSIYENIDFENGETFDIEKTV